MRDLSIAACFYLTIWGLPLILLTEVFLRYALNYAAVPRQLTCEDDLKTIPSGHDSEQKTGAECFPILAWQWEKRSNVKNGFFAASRWEDAVGLTAHSANKTVLCSHLKPLVHSFCSPWIMQFALAMIGNVLVINSSSPCSNVRLEVPYKDRKTGEEHLGIFLHVAEVILWERDAECNYWPLSLLFISAILVAESAWGQWKKRAATLPEEGKYYLQMTQVRLNSTEKFDTDPEEIKALLHLTLSYCP